MSSLALGGWSAVNLEDVGDELNPASGGLRVGVAEEERLRRKERKSAVWSAALQCPPQGQLAIRKRFPKSKERFRKSIEKFSHN